MEPAVVVYPSAERSEKVIVMLHGLGNSILPFSEFLSRNSDVNPNTTVVVVTYGVGFETFSDLVDQLWTILKELQLTCNLIMFGYSMGGFIAQVFAEKYPGSVIGLVLACTGSASYGSIPLTVKGRLLELLSSFHRLDTKAPSLLPRQWFLTEDEVFLMERNEHVDKCLSIERNAQMHSVLQYMAASKNKSLEVVLKPLLHTPTLILHGTDDSVLAFHGACAIHRILKKSSLRIFQGAGHGILIRYPDQVADAVHSWIKDVLLPKTSLASEGPGSGVSENKCGVPDTVKAGHFSFAYVPFAIQGKK